MYYIFSNTLQLTTNYYNSFPVLWSSIVIKTSALELKIVFLKLTIFCIHAFLFCFCIFSTAFLCIENKQNKSQIFSSVTNLERKLCFLFYCAMQEDLSFGFIVCYTCNSDKTCLGCFVTKILNYNRSFRLSKMAIMI